MPRDLYGLAAGLPAETLAQAACRHSTSDRWFFGDEARGTVGGEATRRADAARWAQVQAVAICRRCPVQTECLEFALDTHQRYGIWGGLTTAERERLMEKGA